MPCAPTNGRSTWNGALTGGAGGSKRSGLRLAGRDLVLGVALDLGDPETCVLGGEVLGNEGDERNRPGQGDDDDAPPGPANTAAEINRGDDQDHVQPPVRDAGDAMDALMAYNDRDLDFAKPGVAAGLAATSDAYGKTLARCDGMADPAVRQEGEFRRLIDGAQASLAQIPKAIATRDADLVHRLLIELRSFDNLLAFRFG